MALNSWLEISPESDFSLANLPFGIISHTARPDPHPAVAIGDYALDLDIFTTGNGFAALSVIEPHLSVFSQPTLNAFAALGQPIHSAVRRFLQSVLLETTPFPQILKDNARLRGTALVPLTRVKNHLPLFVRDYTDFYAGINHAVHCGYMLRGPANALHQNYMHLPVGYHGRASSVVISGTPVRRPHGQVRIPEGDPALVPSRKLDMELELGAFLCQGNEMGQPIAVSEAASHIFGLVLLNDWSARDVQAWEATPLGPFNGKNFATTISPWVVLPEALEPFRSAGLEPDKPLLAYLQEKQSSFYDINLEAELTTKSGLQKVVTRVKGDNLIFSFAQMLAHHTVGGCQTAVGDLLGSGTISGKGQDAMGSFLEQSGNGKSPFDIGEGERTFLEDGDSVTLRGSCGTTPGAMVGFGECRGTILPALDFS